MLRGLLKRIYGCGSYEKGSRLIDFATIQSIGSDEEDFSFIETNEVNLEDPEQKPVPILATTLIKKSHINIDNQIPMAFQMNYTNQDNEVKLAKCYIPNYSQPNSDYRIIMPEDNEFVVKINSVEQRVDSILGLLSLDDYTEKFNPQSGVSGGYETNNGAAVTITDEGTFTRVHFQSDDSQSHNVHLIALEQSIIDENNPYKSFNKNPFYIEEFNQLNKLKIKLRFNRISQYMAIVFSSPLGNQTGIVFIFASKTSADVYKEALVGTPIVDYIFDTNDELNVWYEFELPIYNFKADLLRDLYAFNTNFNTVSLYLNEIAATPLDCQFDFEFFDIVHPTGNIGDKVEIVGMLGNIAKLQGAYSIGLSEIKDLVPLVSTQYAPYRTYRGGMNQLFYDYGLDLIEQHNVSFRRMFLQLFSNYAIPSTTFINQSLTRIYQILNPDGSIYAYGDFENPYKMVIVIETNSNLFTVEELIETIKIFIERYRPVPATVEYIVQFATIPDTLSIGESLRLIVTTSPVKFSPSLKFSPTLLFGSETKVYIDLPATYP